ncbi:hypothetical protein KDW_38920 [Dictyobacter vulcani]|uniref:TIR domain-containing protein n=1 Tax=Dictyobacter vulcani TaxID=2607529 RepID=A0A5J4KTD4_9CHLR|nr:toll/interleukin-1 receptor domain-containing protein [Dictyobacter vulcani]GER89730.1 hypothetical protein KDW_38920 [Dictyobacter vulcani]
MSVEKPDAVEIFISYAHEDELFVSELNKHLSTLRRQGMITSWYDRDIAAGEAWSEEINTRLNRAALILFLISADFINSDYCYDVELKRAIERQSRQEAWVIPIIVRPCDWKGTPFAHLQALPDGSKAVSKWSDRDEAFLNIIRGIRGVLSRL